MKPGSNPVRERHSTVSEWVEQHRRLDKMLYDMMPSTFMEIKEYPKELEQKEGKEVATKDQREHGLVVNEFNSPWFSSRMMSPFLPILQSMEQEMRELDSRMMAPWMRMEQQMRHLDNRLQDLKKDLEFEEKDGVVKYKIQTTGFKPESIKMTLVGDELSIEAKEEDRVEEGETTRRSSRHMYRSFTLPRGVRQDDITTSLSDKGELTVSFKLPEPVHIPIGQQAEQAKLHASSGK